MAYQIIQQVPDEKTIRQQALQQGFDQVGQGLVNYIGAVDQQKATKRQQALDLLNTTSKLREAGYDVTPDQVKQMYFPEEKPSFKSVFGFGGDEEEIQEQAPQADLFAKRTPEYLQGEEDKKIQREIQLARLKNLKSGKYSAGGGKPSKPVSGYETASPDVKVTPQDIEDVKKSEIATKNVVDRINSLSKNIKEYGFATGFGITKGDRAVGSDIADLQLEMKELARLGALAGPDLELVNASLSTLSGPLDAINPLMSREDAVAQLKTVAEKAVNRLKNISETRGLKKTSENIKFIDPYMTNQQSMPVPSGSTIPNQDAELQELQMLRAKKAGVR
jgi:uncharacterized protein YnzC (UPF0291/DUF896 family)